MARLNFYNLNSFTKQYVVTALWSTNDESTPSGGVPLDDNYDHTNISDETLAKMAADCEKFLAENSDDIDRAVGLYNVTDGTDSYSYAGHDLWLSRNGHGCGFFNRSELGTVLSERLQNAAEKCGEYHLYVGDDGKIYGENG